MNYTTQMDAAKKGIITKEMQVVAEKEGINIETLMNLMQTQLAYQASMKATTTISQLSLLNYM